MFNQYRQCFKVSIRALLANKVRSFLTMTGIIIGVSAVIIIMAVGAGAQSLILAQVKTLGTDLIGVLPGKAEEDGPPASIMGIIITTLTYDDAVAMAESKNVPNVTAVVAYTKGTGTAVWGANSYDTNLSGCTTGYMEVESGEVLNGRFFNKGKIRSQGYG